MKPRVSIAMCTYNGAKYISEQIVSLDAQTNLPFELIICDDMSNDGTIQVIESLASAVKFPIRIVVNPERLGYRRNFMKAASLCEGDLIAFCDQDDVWRPDKLARVSEAFDDPDVMMVHHNARVVAESGAPIGRLDKDHAYPPSADPLTQNPWHYCLGFTQTFRREIARFNALRGRFLGEAEQEWTAHDQWISFICSSLGKTIYITDDLVDYRQHGNNTYGTKRSTVTPSLKEKIHVKLNDYRDYNILKKVCLRRQGILSEVAANPETPVELQKRATGAEAWYGKLAELYGLRAVAYSGEDVLTRTRAWSCLLRAKAYDKRNTLYFTSRSAVRDLVQGVLLARLRTGSAPTADFSLRVNGASRRP